MFTERKMSYTDISNYLDGIIKDGGYVIDENTISRPGDGIRYKEVFFSLDRSKKKRIAQIYTGYCIGGGEEGRPCVIITKDDRGKLLDKVNWRDYPEDDE